MFTQENRILQIATPLGDDDLLLTGFTGSEGISTLFSYELDLISETQHDLTFKDIIGKNVTVSVELPDENQRYFNGIINSFSQKGVEEDEEGQLTSFYSATMVPWLWLLNMTTNIRIYQQKSALDIVEEILGEKGIPDLVNQVQGSPEVREYCVQYRETDFNFISRLLEEEGIFYYFGHDNGKHSIILADSPDIHEPCPFHEEAVSHTLTSGTTQENSVINQLAIGQEIHPGKCSLNDFNPDTSTTNLLVEVDGQGDLILAPGTLEVYDAPGEYYTRSVGEVKATNIMQEIEAQITVLHGSSDIPPFASGFKFKHLDHQRGDIDNTDFLITSVNHTINQVFGTGEEETSYSNTFTCIPFAIPFRPPRKTPKPIVEGVHTAIVVGTSGEEIYTDKYGRIKVQFHWDREGVNDDKSSCWMRVSQPWAGAKWGAITIPRIGQEVIVSFIDGDPDRPIVTGTVYNNVNMPPYSLPDNKTRTTLKSNSSTGGGGYNEIRFEDKAGVEEMFFHAQYDHNTLVKNDQATLVESSSHLTVNGDQYEQIATDKHLTVKGDHNEKVDGTISLESGMDFQQKVGMNYANEAGMDMHLKGGMNVVIEAGLQLTLKGPGGFITISPAGVSIQGNLVLINSGGAAGVGLGSSPEEPKKPKTVEADEAGGPAELPPTMEYVPQPIQTSQAQVLQHAAESGRPFCEI